MIAMIKKEINLFFASPIGYLVIALFLIINGLFLWVFSGNYNILDAGFADLAAYFDLAPLLLMFLVPAVSMRAFSDEMRMGTLELLRTKPISLLHLVLGKYFGTVILIVVALVPTLLYVITISSLTSMEANWDVGSTIGSYIGLLFLVLAYTAIGVFSSTLSKNQIVAFILGVTLSFFMFYGFEALSDLKEFKNFDIRNFGLYARFTSIGRGVIDTKDLIYFLSVTFFFLWLTKNNFDLK